jgi:hypothetical protein
MLLATYNKVQPFPWASLGLNHLLMAVGPKGVILGSATRCAWVCSCSCFVYFMRNRSSGTSIFLGFDGGSSFLFVSRTMNIQFRV